MDTRIYRYIVAYDGGTAPNPFDGYCTLAICKPAIRRTARVGDWVVGFRSQHRGEVLYAMQVAESIPFDAFWNDPRFRNRRPGNALVPTDNIYRPVTDGPVGEVLLEWVENKTHDRDASKRDLGGRRVLVAKRFWYFGSESKSIDPELFHLAPVTQGHVVHAHRKLADVDKLVTWLSKFPHGVQGQPIDRKSLTNQGLA